MLVTGMSGAGRSTVLKNLEDHAWEVVDNLPLALLEPFLEAKDARPLLAVGMDSRTRDFVPARVAKRIAALRKKTDVEITVIFVDCDDDILQRRFTETRRRHPLAGDRPVLDGILEERTKLDPLRQIADYVLDTSNMTAVDLRRMIAGRFHLDEAAPLTVTIVSFSFKRGLPREADLVFDVRFLSNPFYVDDLRPLSGIDPRVGAHIEQDSMFEQFFKRLVALLLLLLPAYDQEGKSYLTIAVGCTGGRHRSVYVAERLSEQLTRAGQAVTVRHRDVDKEK